MTRGHPLPVEVIRERKLLLASTGLTNPSRPDGRAIDYGDFRHLELWQVLGMTRGHPLPVEVIRGRKLLSASTGLTNLSRPDGRAIDYCDFRHLELWQVLGRDGDRLPKSVIHERQLLSSPTGPTNPTRPDGRAILYGDIRRLERSRSRSPRRMVDAGRQGGAWDWSSIDFHMGLGDLCIAQSEFLHGSFSKSFHAWDTIVVVATSNCVLSRSCCSWDNCVLDKKARLEIRGLMCTQFQAWEKVWCFAPSCYLLMRSGYHNYRHLKLLMAAHMWWLV